MAQHPRPVGPTTNNAAAFSQEMVVGVRPYRGVTPFMAKVGYSVSQTTPVAAPFIPAMSAGYQPSSPVRSKPFGSGSFVQPPEIPVFSIEMVTGSHPDRGRQLLAARIPLPVSETTPIAAPFTPDMAYGSIPSRPRLPFVAQLGWSTSQLTFAVEMTPDQWKGDLPTRNRQLLGVRIPLPLAQTTHVNAPFTPDMVQGWHPDAARIKIGPRIPLPILPPTIDVFSVEMVQGSRPDKNRVTYGSQKGQSLSQTTHVPSPFRPEMSIGYHPDRQRGYLPLRVGWLVWAQDIAQTVFVADACNTFRVGADQMLTVAGEDTGLIVLAEVQSFDVEGCE